MKKEIISFEIGQSTKVIAFTLALATTPISIVGVLLLLGGIFSSFTELLLIGIMYVCMPILYLLFGYIFTALFLWLYNIVAKKVGGITYTIKENHTH